MRNVFNFYGRDIDEEKIGLIKKITAERYDKSIFDSSYWSLFDIDSLSHILDVNVDDIILTLGEDWFLLYSTSDSYVTILEWVASNNLDCKFVQIIEMLNTFKGIFLKFKDMKFSAYMRHDSSFPFYSKMLQQGFFEETFHSIGFDNCSGYAPERLKYLDEEYSGFDDFLVSDEAVEHPEYLKYILHDLQFLVTDKFVKKYEKSSK